MPNQNLSTAEALYQSIVDVPDPLAMIMQFVADNVEESDYLEFKRYEPGKDIKAKWAKMLSGFANAGGGVVVWGIDTARIEQGTIDKAVKLVPIKDPEACRSTLVELFNRMTDPPIKGVECRAVTNTDGSGFVACYVPNGSHKPYRSIVEAGHPFYLRAGDDFHPININLLRMLFYPQLSVQWSCVVESGVYEPQKNYIRVRFRIKLTNHGPSTAENVTLSIRGNGQGHFRGYSEPFCTCLDVLPGGTTWKVNLDMNPTFMVHFDCDFSGANDEPWSKRNEHEFHYLPLTITVTRRDAIAVSGTTRFFIHEIKAGKTLRDVILTETE